MRSTAPRRENDAQARARSRASTTGSRLLVPAVLVAAVLAGGGTTLAVTHTFDSRDGGTEGTDGSSPSPSHPLSPPPLPTARNTTPPHHYHRVRDRAGFSVSVPNGWKRNAKKGYKGNYVIFSASSSSAASLDIQIDGQAGGGDPPDVNGAANMRDKSMRGEIKSYKKVGMTDNTVLGMKGKRWEYTYTDGGTKLHNIAELLVDPAGQGWFIEVTGGAEKEAVDETRQRFRDVIDSFQLDTYI